MGSKIICFSTVKNDENIPKTIGIYQERENQGIEITILSCVLPTGKRFNPVPPE